MNIIVKQFLLRLAALTLLFAFVAILSQRIYTNISQGKIDDYITEDAEKEVGEINMLFNTALTKVGEAKYYISMKKFISLPNKAEGFTNSRYPDIIETLQSIRRDYDFFECTWLISVSGNYYLEDNEFVSDSDWELTTRPYYNELIKNTNAFITEPYISNTDGKKIVSVIQPLRDNNQELIGAFAVDLNMNQFNTFMEDIYIRENNYLTLVTADGVIVSNIEEKTYSGKMEDSVYSFGIKEAVQSGHEGIITTKASDDTPYIVYIKETIVPGWRLIVSNTLEHYKEYVKADLRLTNIQILLAVVLLYVAIVMWIVMLMFNKLKSQRLLDYDPLTHLYNFNGFLPKMAKRLEKNKTQSYIGVYFKIKKMYLISEMFGAQVCDAIILHIADCLRKSVSEAELCCRVDESQFAMFLHYENEERLIKRLKMLENSIESLYGFSEETFRIPLVFGCYVVPDNSMSVHEIDRCVKMAIERSLADETYENKIVFFDKSLKETLQLEKELEDSAEKAIRDDEFVFYLQGKYKPDTGKVESAEALVRWSHKEKGLISPGRFIPLFERNGFITKLDMHVLEQVCKRLRMWLDNGTIPIPIAVNMSRNHLDNHNFVLDTLTIIDRYNIPHSLIELEITESAIGNDSEFLIQVIKEFRSKDIHVAIDDFGAGYSTLGTLKELVVDTLKVDREFFVDMHTNERSKSVVRSVISMAKGLNLKTVAEGIETIEQVDFLIEERVDLIQGYYFSEPLPVNEFEVLLDNVQEEEENKTICIK